jgi:hypothetical protein
MINFWNHLRGAPSRARSESTAAAPTSTEKAVRSYCEDEELSTFLDGRLGGRERSKMIGHLAEADDAYEVFACTAVMLSDDGDALLDRMQTAEVRAAARRAFDASPDDLRTAAIEAARNSAG